MYDELNRVVATFRKYINEIAFVATITGGVSGWIISPESGALLGSLAALVTLALVHFVKSSRDELVPSPTDFFEVDDFAIRNATPALLESAIAIAHEAFSPNTIDPKTIWKLYSIDPSFFFIVTEGPGESVVGYLDFYVLRPTEFVSKFKSGEADDTDFDIESVCQTKDLLSGSIVYLGGIAVVEDSHVRRGKMARALVLAFIERISTLMTSLGAQHVELISVAYSLQGKRLLESFGFAAADPSIKRKDQGQFYSRTLDAGTLILLKTLVSQERHHLPGNAQTPRKSPVA